MMRGKAVVLGHVAIGEARSAALCLLLATFGSARAFAGEPDDPPVSAAANEGLLPVPDYGGDLLHRSHLTGDWGGARTDLANRGVTFDVDWTQYLQGVVQGGLDRTTQYGGHLDYVVHLDLMRMGLVPGALVTVRAETRYGNSVNGQSGLILPVNTTAFFPLTDGLDDNVSIAVTDLNWTQFFSEKLALVVGKVDTLDADLNEFASGRGKSQFMDANFLFNSTLALRLPYSTLGAAALWIPSKTLTVNASVVNTVDSSTTTGFGDFGNGTTATAEVDSQYRIGDLPGGANFGGIYSFDQDFNQVGGKLVFQPGQGLVAPTENHTWAVYANTWQYLFTEDRSDAAIDLRNGTPDRQGVGVFGRLGYADATTNPIRWSCSLGVGGRGMLPTRDYDTFGVGYYYTRIQETRFSASLGVQDHTQGMEAYYDVALTPASHLAVDLQLQDSPLSSVDTDVILGVRLNLTF
jgi:porin